ncbi:glycosyltransferase [Ideonella livida]|uniref:Glycosyltransferase n=1 Tax=Ideonella livida TaxID=2707176 RepID=A0A7C9PIC7_9BURK|nr:glycosyltransferase [Ideonella livida]NDY92755.1 glycosyltransferase [Ideonella livida]
MSPTDLQHVSVVVPVYGGETTLPTLIQELLPLTQPGVTPGGVAFAVTEILLVHDCGRDRSDLVMEALAARHPVVRPVWLTRNFGQHPATLAGMASATGHWIVTLDEDGQQDPRDIGALLDLALGQALQLVYASPTNQAPHGAARNFFSATAKAISRRVLGHQEIGRFNSFRLIDGEIARTLAAYCGTGVYLDVGLRWLVGRVGFCPVQLRREMDRPSNYNYRRLASHFWRLVLTTGTRPLRLITLVGLCSLALAFGLTAWVIWSKLHGGLAVPGWASLFLATSLFSGAILTALGIIAEYLAVTMGIAMGKPLYVVGTKPTRPAPPPRP